MKDIKIIAQVTLEKDEYLVKQKKTRIVQPNYYKIGNGTMNKHSIKSIDLLAIAMELPKPAQYVLKWIKDGMVWNSHDERIEFLIKVVPETKAGKRTLVNGFKILKEKDLVRRIKRSHYMINPNAIITDYEKQLTVWNQ